MIIFKICKEIKNKLWEKLFEMVIKFFNENYYN